VSAKPTRETRVTATLSEHSVKAARGTVPRGQVTFAVRNKGKGTHELLVLWTNATPNALPQNGGKVEERGLVDEVENVRPGKTRTLTVRLKPGRYVLICNIAGHYAAGMHAALRVT